MNKSNRSKYSVLVVLAIALSFIAIHSWESWSIYTSITEFNEIYNPAVTSKYIEQITAELTITPETKGATALLGTASTELKMLYELLLLNSDTANLRLQSMFYIICGLVLFIFVMAVYVLFFRKKF
jgi:hypothetical protein